MAAKNSNMVESIKHTTDGRVNIPTNELRAFVAEEERAPYNVKYPRDQSLDPQLVWKGKDTQDAVDLQVPAVPIYIQEKVHPEALVRDVIAASNAQAERDSAIGDLFADFNGVGSFERAVDFYKHEQHWSNRLILGDSLLIMNSLAEKEGLKGKVQMLYFDPPYGIKFGSNWQVSTRKRDVKDGKVEDMSREPEVVRAFRDTWELGIHSYLAYLRDRFVVARELLTESGSIFIQIGDENVHLVRNLLDEVFGPENFVSQITVRKTTSEGSSLIGSTCDFILWYGKNKEQTKFRALYTPRSDDAEGRYDQTWFDGRLYQLGDITSSRPAGEGDAKEFDWFGKTFDPGKGTFKTTHAGLTRLAKADRLQVTGNGKLRYRRFANDFGYGAIANLWGDISGAVQSRSDPKVYVVQTSTRVVERCMLMATDPGDLVMDPTCGSGTTAYAAEQWGRRWITTDTSRVALALARTRLMSARFPFYLLSDSDEGRMKEAELSGVAPSPDAPKAVLDVRKGFVCKRIPHITLGAIANNAAIDDVYAKWEGPIAAALQSLRKL